MTDISVIILVGKEELHIRRCLEKLAPLEPRQIFVVESQKGDRTHEIAVEMGATTVWHDCPGLYAKQFNWALAYFIYRYILRGGFLEGHRGFKWHFFQGLWYRMLVDAKIEEIKSNQKF